MRVLLLARDLYANTGGGEAVYRRVIAANPAIEFVYFRELEAAHAARPANARCVMLGAPRRLTPGGAPLPTLRLDRLRAADAYARAVAGQDFDVIELPDYVFFGDPLRDVLAFNRVRHRALVLAMHGNFSTSAELAWDADAGFARAARELEREQFAAADARYAISTRYAREWQARVPAEIHLLDPLSLVAPPAPRDLSDGARRPDLYCIGRMERRKGNDLFVEMLRWLERSAYDRAVQVGNPVDSRFGRSSGDFLSAIAATRQVEIDFLPGQDRAGLEAIFAGASFVVLPVRYDAFNLVALEALFKGCPTAVSSGAGVCDFLDERLPELPYVKIDLGNFYAAIGPLGAALADYPAYRRRLAERLRAMREPAQPPDLQSFYADAIRRGARRQPAARGAPALRPGLPIGWRIAARALRRAFPAAARRARNAIGFLDGLRRSPATRLAPLLRGRGAYSDAVFVWHLAGGLRLGRARARLARLPEDGPAALEAKLRALHAIAAHPLGRFALWRELARLERLRGNELVAAAYEIRLLRLGAPDAPGHLAATLASLERLGYAQEALALRAMVEPGDAARRVHEYLRAAFERHRASVPRPWQLLDDRRFGEAKVAVIVSLYNAAPKLRLFLTCLAEQTLVKQRKVEVILVDSASPADERAVVETFLAGCPLSLVYARSEARETIQAAWNRGIHLARAPYLVFLGADETLYPEALELLAGELDRDPAADWAMADSLVTDTDARGVFERDVMTYARHGATKDHVYLETCYLSWVGGMYRKSIHERFGYYDESFRGAGDTEFKNRVLPHIAVRFVARTLGVFLNYPDARVTGSASAEIEDLRAWYLHRTPGGVRYAFERRAPREALTLCIAALGYRKSYRRHLSCDIEYARHLLDYAIPGLARPELLRVRDDLDRLLGGYRAIEDGATNAAMPRAALGLLAQRLRFGAVQGRHARLFAGEGSPRYKLFNDNRYEQHHWPWAT